MLQTQDFPGSVSLATIQRLHLANSFHNVSKKLLLVSGFCRLPCIEFKHTEKTQPSSRLMLQGEYTICSRAPVYKKMLSNMLLLPNIVLYDTNDIKDHPDSTGIVQNIQQSIHMLLDHP